MSRWSLVRLARILILVVVLAVVLALAVLASGCTASPTPAGEPASTPPLPAPSQSAAAYYVRPDGGDAKQCTGIANAPYPGQGSGQPCAWNHPFQALPPQGAARIAGGDTLIIASGSYMMGYGAPGAAACDVNGPWDCVMAAVPSGADAAHRTRILGQGWDAGCGAPPQLWGTERAEFVLNLTDSSFVEVGCLEITDHSGCVEHHSGGLACQRDAPPFGAWASRGLYAEDSTGVYLHDLNIHGLASTGVHAGRLRDWLVENVRIAGNGMAGWDGDLWDGSDSNSGTLTFRRWLVEWNGCGETWPGGQPAGCWAQEAGGYGDGVGTGATGGRWIIEDSLFRFNTSDGLDLLYARQPGSQIDIRRTIAVGNAGNQIKTAGPTTIENSVVVGNCAFFQGKAFTYNVDHCRAAGNALSLTLRPGNVLTVTNTTVASQGDCLVLVECDGSCTGNEQARLRNVLFQGAPDFLQPGDVSCLVYEEGFPRTVTVIDHGLINGVKDNACPGTGNLCAVPPGVVNAALSAFDARLLPNSPAIDAGNSDGAPLTDITGVSRDARPDIGAYEFRPAGQPGIYLPVLLAHFRPMQP